MIFDIAIGTAIGTLCAAILALLGFQWYRLACTDDGWPRARRYGLVLVAITLAGGILWLAAPFIQNELAQRQQRIASTEKAAHDRIYCTENKFRLISEATEANIEPRDVMGMNRSLRAFKTVKSTGPLGIVENRIEKSAYGWLQDCKMLGVVTSDELQHVAEQYKIKQDAYDAAEIAKVKARIDALSR